MRASCFAFLLLASTVASAQEARVALVEPGASGDCIVHCNEGAACNIEGCSGEVTECPDGITTICGTTSCPS